MSEETRKRSRFDQTEPEPVRKSRFDRRSRSPSSKGANHTRRDRSPVTKSIESPGDKREDAASAAAAAAAKINAQINAKKGIQHVDVPPIRAAASPGAGPGSAKSPSQAADSGTLNAEIYTQDGDYIKDIEVNDLRNRYTLTKGSTQKMIKEKTGADVTTRGNYYPDKSMATAANPPLYLHVTSTTKDGLEKAVQEINQLMQQELPNLIDERRFRRNRDDAPRLEVERDHLGRRKWPEERIPIDLEPIPGFNLRAQVVGAGGSYVKHIQQETRCRVQIKGRGSGFMEHDTQHESDEPMYLHVAGPDATEVERAKEMCISLLKSVTESYDAFKERGPRGSGSYGGDRYNGGGGDRGGYQGRRQDSNGGGYGQQDSYGGGSSYGNQSAGGYGGGSSYGNQPQSAGYGGFGGGAQSPQSAQPASAMSAGQQAQAEAWATYYDQNPTADPYVTYGGYRAYMQMMAQYYPQGYPQGQAGSLAQAQSGYGQMPAQNGAAGGAPPPPPPDDGQAPPPPPPGGNSGYNNVPPPPGM